MLSTLSVRNIVLIDQLDIVLDTGLTVLTGETGAGKSILLDALTLALGGRGDASLVRAGMDSGQVDGRAASAAASTRSARCCATTRFPTTTDVILRRVQYADGRTRAFINDQPVSASLLREVGALAVEIHGQHDDRALVDTATHRALLDAFGGHAGAVEAAAARPTRPWSRPNGPSPSSAPGRRGRGATRTMPATSSTNSTNWRRQPGEESELAERRQHLMQAREVGRRRARRRRDAQRPDRRPARRSRA